MSEISLPFAEVNVISAPTKTKTNGILALTKWKTYKLAVALLVKLITKSIIVQENVLFLT